MIFSKQQLEAIAALAVLSGALGSPLTTKIEQIKHLLGRDTFEWTAIGDSYSSGVGAGEYISNAYRCLRYDHAYPILMNGDPRLPGGAHQFNNVVCSGSSTEDVDNWQFLDKDTSGKPSFQYGDRPKFGSPSMASLSVGGNDIDFPGIIFNCILEWNVPGGPPFRECDDQRKVTWELLRDPKLVDKVDSTIKKAVEKARKGPVGDKFQLYVTGFPQFFSAETNECDSVTFARAANPKDDGKPHTKMTQELRRDYNAMSVKLNEAIESAVARNADRGVKWIPIDGVVQGHRYCEPGVKEPNQKNKNLWLFHYPYDEPEDETVDGPLRKAHDKISSGVDVASKFHTYNSYQNALLDAVELDGNSDAQGFYDFFWRRLGPRFKTFHPQIPLHEKIRDLVLDAYIAKLQEDKPKPKPFEEKNACHGVSGDTWVMSRDVAVDNAKAFCQQTNPTVKYNEGSVNELELSVRNLNGGGSKGPKDAPDCLGRFQRAVIDGCDGDDHVNNPHNYKFGSTLTSADGWEYKMTPLSKQVNEVSCDVSYKFLYDGVEIRGKNLPDAKLGANGEGLRKELSGCGALTKWKFERTPDDVKFQWYAAGRLPIGTKACVGRALVSAGGSGHGNCHGAGKRDDLARRRPIGIEDWPGYGDEGRHVFKDPVV